MNARVTTPNTSVNENVKKCEVVLHISRNWCTGQSGGGQSTCKHSYTFTLCFAQWLAHLWKNSHNHLLLHITSLLSNLWKILHILLHTMTHLHIYKHTYTFTLCFTQPHNKFVDMISSLSSHTFASLVCSTHSHFTYSHLWIHLYMEQINTLQIHLIIGSMCAT